jgi:hypothetical protein
MTELEALSLAREKADAEFAAACRNLSDAQKAVHAVRNRQKAAQRRYIEQLIEKKAA